MMQLAYDAVLPTMPVAARHRRDPSAGRHGDRRRQAVTETETKAGVRTGDHASDLFRRPL